MKNQILIVIFKNTSKKVSKKFIDVNDDIDFSVEIKKYQQALLKAKDLNDIEYILVMGLSSKNNKPVITLYADEVFENYGNLEEISWNFSIQKLITSIVNKSDCWNLENNKLIFIESMDFQLQQLQLQQLQLQLNIGNKTYEIPQELQESLKRFDECFGYLFVNWDYIVEYKQDFKTYYPFNENIEIIHVKINTWIKSILSMSSTIYVDINSSYHETDMIDNIWSDLYESYNEILEYWNNNEKLGDIDIDTLLSTNYPFTSSFDELGDTNTLESYLNNFEVDTDDSNFNKNKAADEKSYRMNQINTLIGIYSDNTYDNLLLKVAKYSDENELVDFEECFKQVITNSGKVSPEKDGFEDEEYEEYWSAFYEIQENIVNDLSAEVHIDLINARKVDKEYLMNVLDLDGTYVELFEKISNFSDQNLEEEFSDICKKFINNYGETAPDETDEEYWENYYNLEELIISELQQ